MNRRLSALAGVVVIGGLLAAGCGSSEGSNDASSTTQTSAQLTGEPIKLGVIADTGQGDLDAIVTGADAAAQAINNAGGVNQRPLEIVSCDMKADPNQATQCARDLIGDGVVAFVTIGGSNSAAAIEVVNQEKVASIGELQTSAVQLESEVSFGLGSGIAGTLTGEGDLAGRLGAEKVALVTVDGPQSGPLIQFIENGLAMHDLKVDTSVALPLGAPDMSPYAAAAVADGADTVLVNIAPSDIPAFTRALRSTGQSPKVITFQGSIEGAVGIADEEDLEGIYAVAGAKPATLEGDPGVQKFQDEVAAVGGTVFNQGAANAWAAVYVFNDAAQTLTDITASTVLAAIPTLTNVETGITPPLDFSKKIVINGEPSSVYTPYVFYVQFKDGEIVAAEPDFAKVLE